MTDVFSWYETYMGWEKIKELCMTNAMRLAAGKWKIKANREELARKISFMSRTGNEVHTCIVLKSAETSS
jgi:hypothetical protein